MLFSTDMIPADITTFEQLVTWCGTCLSYNGFSLTYNERQPSAPLGDSGIQSVFERTGPFRAFDDTPRIIFRFGMEMVPDYASSAYTMDYQATKEVITSSPNVNFLSSTYQGT